MLSSLRKEVNNMEDMQNTPAPMDEEEGAAPMADDAAPAADMPMEEGGEETPEAAEEESAE